MTAARQWRLVWVLRVVPGTTTINERADRPEAWLNTCREDAVFNRCLCRGPWKGSNAVRGDGLGRAHPFWRRTDDGHYPCVQRARGAVEV